MKEWWEKIRWWVVGVSLGLAFLVWRQWPDGKLHLVACDVGQGEAILIEQGFLQVLVDGGPSGERVLRCLQEEMPFWDRRIELIVMTHSDFDHINGLIDVLKRYSLLQFVTGDGINESQTTRRLTELVRGKKLKVEGVEMGDVVVVRDKRRGEELKFRVLWPNELKREKVAVFSGEGEEKNGYQILGVSAKRARRQSNNWRSVVLELDWHGYRALLTGDADFQAEQGMLEAGVLDKVNYLKVGHHGSKSSSSLEFLEVVRPEVAVISVGKKNRYGHPAAAVLERLKKVGARVRRTDEEGKVEMVVRER